jgi:hypothetical protein
MYFFLVDTRTNAMVDLASQLSELEASRAMKGYEEGMDKAATEATFKITDIDPRY